MSATVMSPVSPMRIFISCSSVLCVPMASGMFMSVKVMSSLISVTSPPPRLCSPSVRTVVQWGISGALAFCVSFVSCIVMMSGWVLCTRVFSSSILFLMPFMLV